MYKAPKNQKLNLRRWGGGSLVAYITGETDKGTLSKRDSFLSTNDDVARQ